MTRDLSALRHVPLCAGCTDKELSEITVIGDEVDIDQGEVIVDRSATAERSFIILEGSAVTDDQPSRTLGRGTVFGEMAVLDGGPRSATVTAATPMRLLVLDPPAVVRLLDVAGIARRVARTAVDRLRSSAD
jgi:CRP/FNR family transcriptional regulator, cyclic AMP receptor protein